jgi:hypothetical protein
MTAAIEYAVRPAASPSPHGTTIIATTPGATRERATITWGAQATMPVPSMAVNTACCKEDLNEASREGEVVRITQPGNSDNYIDVFRANKVHLDKKDDNTCSPTSVAGQDSFAPTDFSVSGFEPSTFEPTDSGVKQCKTTWILKNNTAPP